LPNYSVDLAIRIPAFRDCTRTQIGPERRFPEPYLGGTNFHRHIVNSLPETTAINNLIISEGKVKVKFPLEQAMKAQRGSRGIALLFL
jgi:hypothetical protein